MPCLTWTRTSFSMVDGGGVHGTVVGTARGIMIQVGAIIGDVHLFIEAYPPVGGMTTGRVVGEGVNGISKEYPTNRFKKTGGHGKRLSIGRKKTDGVSRVIIKRLLDQNKRLDLLNKKEIGETMKDKEVKR